MSAMRFLSHASVFSIAALAILAPSSRAQTGSIEFLARATPSGGLEEPVRGFPFYLLSKSFEEINKEVDASDPEPDMNAFIDKLDVSSELKAWMKKNHWVRLSGQEFTDKLTPADIVKISDFFSAYLERSEGAAAYDFPKPKYRPADKTKDPAKYEKLRAEYQEAVEHYIEQNPRSKEGMDLFFADKEPSTKWQVLVGRRNLEIHRRAVDLAQSKYLVERAETNLEGQGFLNGVPPGTYWLSTLDVTADVGDTRPQWDVPVSVRPGETAYVVLSNVNAAQSSRPSF
jgi:hypothetical protein